MKKYFPTIIVDDFLENPDKIRKMALDMNYFPNEGHYPGTRTKNLSEIDEQLFNYLTSRFFLILYDFNLTVNWTLTIQFQSILPFSENKNDLINHAWTHVDSNKILAGVLYLNPNAQLDTGTNIYKNNDSFDDNIFKMDMLSQTRIPFYKDGNKPTNYEENLKKHNNMFSETINISNIYNRLIMFDAFEYHRAQNYYSVTGEPRLICNFFVDELSTDSLTPLERLRKHKMEHFNL
jgi:hypothetical protein